MTGRDPRPAPGLLRRIAALLIRSSDARFILDDLDEIMERELAGGTPPWRARWRYGVNALASAFSVWRARLRRSRRVAASWLDVKLGLRMLVKHPGLTLVGGLALAVAIGIGAGWLELMNERLHPDLPLDEGDRVVSIRNWDAAAGEPEPRSLHDFATWLRDLESVEDLGAYRTLERNLIGRDGRGEPVVLAAITASGFRVARVPPSLGRLLVEEDQREGAPPVVVIGHDVWRTRFAGDPDIVGRTLRLGGTRHTVVGVMPEGFAFPVNHRLWVPLRSPAAPRAPLEGPGIRIFGRLAPGVTLAGAQAELTALGERAAADSPDTHGHLRPQVLPYAGAPPGGGGVWQFLALHAVILMILLAASANVATLVYARTATREAEIAVRNALGASRGRIILQLFIEALVLASAASALGLAAAHWGLEWGMAYHWESQNAAPPFWWDPGLELSTVLYVGGLTVLGAAVIGLLPAIGVTRPHVRRHLQTLAAGGSRLRFGGIWTALIVIQVALTVVFLAPGVGLTWETIRDRAARARFPAEEYLSVRLELDREYASRPGIETPEAEFTTRIDTIYRELERRLARAPGVTGVTFADRLPGMGHPVRRVEVEARAASEPIPIIPDVRVSFVGADFFETFRTPILSGRGFHRGDLAPDARTVVVNQAFVRRHLGGQNPLGRRVRYVSRAEEEPGPWYEIVGMVRDLGMDPTDFGEAAFVFHPASPGAAYPPHVAVHVGRDPAALAPRLRAIGAELDLGLRLHDLRPLDEIARQREMRQMVATLAAAVLIALALLLSAAGIYSLMSFSVARRTREIGVRTALGASPRRVLGAIFSRAAAQIGAGIVAGNLPLALIAAVRPAIELSDFAQAVGVTSTIMLAVGLLACVVPARRALRIEPTRALKDA